MSDQVFGTLKQWFGFEKFRPLQEEIVRTILDAKDCLAILPTGGGKSLCFQLPGLMMTGNVIVISPLISLMTDQVANLEKKGIAAVAVHSNLPKEEKEQLRRDMLASKFTFIYVSPETLTGKWFRKHAYELNIELVVVDEAHCISEWGHQFRPDYLQIVEWVKLLPKRPVIAAFTASATPETVIDISAHLQLKDPQYFRQSILRPNLSLQVIPCPTKTLQHLALLRLLHHHRGQSLIVYGATHEQTESTAQILNTYGFIAEAYHGGLESHDRQRIQAAFIENKIPIICATTAFGMGVDKPNIRAVIHLTHPGSLEHYYQEVGRAGRDGAESSCYLLTLPGDGKLQHQIICRNFPKFSDTENVLEQLLLKNVVAGQTISFVDLYAPLQTELSVFAFTQVIEHGNEYGWWEQLAAQKNFTVLKSLQEILKELHKHINQYNHQSQKLLKMISYCERNSCRMRQLLGYFEPQDQHPKYIRYRCKKCDICQPSQLFQATASERKNFSLLGKFFYTQTRKQHTLLTENYDWSVAKLTLQVLATTHTYIQKGDASLPGIGRGWRETIDDVSKHQTVLWKTVHINQDLASSATALQSELDQMAQYQSAPRRIDLDKSLSLNTPGG